jgi:NCAIR mutase (PurE)-related protein
VTDIDFARTLCERNLANAIRDAAREYRRLVQRLDELQIRAGQLDATAPEAYKVAADALGAINTTAANSASHRIVVTAGDFDLTMASFAARSAREETLDGE